MTVKRESILEFVYDVALGIAVGGLLVYNLNVNPGYLVISGMAIVVVIILIQLLSQSKESDEAKK